MGPSAHRLAGERGDRHCPAFLLTDGAPPGIRVHATGTTRARRDGGPVVHRSGSRSSGGSSSRPTLPSCARAGAPAAQSAGEASTGCGGGRVGCERATQEQQQATLHSPTRMSESVSAAAAAALTEESTAAAEGEGLAAAAAVPWPPRGRPLPESRKVCRLGLVT